MLKEEYKDCNIHDFDSKVTERVAECLKEAEEAIRKMPVKLLEPSYEFLRGFYDGIFCEQNQFDLDYDYLKGFYKGTTMRFK